MCLAVFHWLDSIQVGLELKRQSCCIQIDVHKEEMRPPARSIPHSDINKTAEYTVVLLKTIKIISARRKSLWPPTDMKTDKTRPIAIHMGYRSDTNPCTAHSYVNTSTCIHTHTHTVHAAAFTTTHDTQHLYFIAPCTLLPDQCVVQTPTDRTHHLMDLLRHTLTHTLTHTHSHTRTVGASLVCSQN